MSSQQQQPTDPLRRPLRVRVEVRGQLGDGSAIIATTWRTLEPHEPEYEQAYIIAAGSNRLYGDPMPYVEAGSGDADIGA